MSETSVSRKRCPDLERIRKRVREKSVSYDQYNFCASYNDFLKAYFDLCQEYDALDDFYRICVAVPLEISGFACALYLLDEKLNQLQLVCNSDCGIVQPPEPAVPPIRLHNEPYETETSYCVPIYSKSLVHQQPKDSEAELWKETGGMSGKSRIFGVFEVRQLSDLSESDRFFLGKYANRIGYNLHNRRIALQNIDHLKFINNLVMDIEHNVIIPNMYFKHLFNQLKKKINEIAGLKNEIKLVVGTDDNEVEINGLISRCDKIQQDMLSYHQELVKHHANLSLFLESLFRREHFERGHLVLRPKRCFIEKDVVMPQLEHYASRLRAANVTIERPQKVMGEEFQILVDAGLLSQVYANLFSNASKYTTEVIDHQGRPRKAMAYGRELIDNYPEPGHQGIKFNVFTTGPHLTEDEVNIIFQEGGRGKDSENIPGSGHGLAFVKHVIELHGGHVGYEATPQGNNFYFILPLPPVAFPPALIDDTAE